MFNILFSLLLIILVVLDQATKYMASRTLSFHKPVPVIPGMAEFQLVHNYGAAYGLFQNRQLLLIAVSIVILVVCFIYRDKLAPTLLPKFGLVFLFAGTIGNVIDRIGKGYVVDFINIHIFPVFNLADIYINIGIFCILIDMFFPGKSSPHETTPGKNRRTS